MSEMDINEVSLRKETEADRDFLLALFISMREGAFHQLGWSHKETRTFLTQQFEAQSHSYRSQFPQAAYQIVEFQGEAIGRVYLNREEAGFHLIDIALLPEFQNRELGRFLLQSILKEAAENSIPVSLHVEHTNPARRLYHRLGFEMCKDLGVYLSMRWVPRKGDEKRP